MFGATADGGEEEESAHLVRSEAFVYILFFLSDFLISLPHRDGTITLQI